MLSTEGQLTGLIYDCMLDDGALSELAEQFAKAFGLHLFVLGWPGAHGRFESIASRHYTAETAAGYRRIQHKDAWLKRLFARPRGRAYSSDDLMPVGELQQTEFYHDYLARFVGQDMVHGLVALADEAQEPAGFGGVRSREAGPLTPTEVRRADRLIPHIQRMIAVRRALAAQRGSETNRDVLDLLTAPVLEVSHGGSILNMNAAAEALLLRGDCLVYDRERGLCGVDPEADDRLRPSIAAACAGQGATILIRRAETGRPLALSIVPLRSRAGRANALVLVSDPDTPVDSGLIKRGFRLSEAEAKVAAAVATGKTLEAIGAERHVSVTTLRAQLKSIYAKTDTARQAELVSLLARLSMFRSTI